MNKRQIKRTAYLDLIYSKYSDLEKENIFPLPMTDKEFVRLITDYFLGKGYHFVDPVSYEQGNVYIAEAIIRNNLPNYLD